jgi:hypothetical protein
MRIILKPKPLIIIMFSTLCKVNCHEQNGRSNKLGEVRKSLSYVHILTWGINLLDSTKIREQRFNLEKKIIRSH